MSIDSLCSSCVLLQASSPKKIKLDDGEREGDAFQKLLSAGWTTVEGRDAIKKGAAWSLVNVVSRTSYCSSWPLC